MTAHCHTKPGEKKPKFKVGINSVTFALIALCLVLSFLVPSFVHFRHSFLEYMKIMALPIFLGILLGGMIDVLIPHSYISKFLASHQKRTIFFSVLLGFLMSVCSHGILALAMELHKKGASGPAVVSFLLASPWTNLPITILLIGFFGPQAFFIIGGAILVAILTGLSLQVLNKLGMIEHNQNSMKLEAGFSIRKDMAKRFKEADWSAKNILKFSQNVYRGAFRLGNMILGWTLLGVLLASLSSAFVPSDFFQEYLGAHILGLLMTMGLAIIIEVCSEGTSPLAFEIYKQTGAFGNVFAFLMGGVVTDFTEVALLWRYIGRKTALWMIVLTLPQVFLIALCFNSFLSSS